MGRGLARIQAVSSQLLLLNARCVGSVRFFFFRRCCFSSVSLPTPALCGASRNHRGRKQRDRAAPSSTVGAGWTVCHACRFADMNAFFLSAALWHQDCWTPVWVCVASQCAKWYCVLRSALEVVVGSASSAMQSRAGRRKVCGRRISISSAPPPRLMHLYSAHHLPCALFISPFSAAVSLHVLVSQ